MPQAVAAGGRVEARRRLVEEDELRVADQGEREVQPPRLPAGERPRERLALLGEPDDLDDLVDVARVRVQAGPVGDRLVDLHVPVHPARLQDDPDALAQARDRSPGSCPSTETMPPLRRR